MSSTRYHPVSAKIRQLLTGADCWFETFEHEPVFTSEEAAEKRSGYELRHGAKAIVVGAKFQGSRERHFSMLVFPADRKFDGAKVRVVLEAKDIRFATQAEVSTLTGGVETGGVPPFGNLFGLGVVADRRLFELERIVFNAGDRRFSIAMHSADYRTLVEPAVEDIVQTG